MENPSNDEFENESTVLDAHLQKYGEYLRRRANVWTEIRSQSALPLGVAVALTNENVMVTVASGASMATDALDGRDARKGAEILKVETSPEGAVADPKADKRLVNGLMLGLLGRFLRQKRFVSAAAIGANYIVTRQRDKRMEQNRSLIVAQQLDMKELKARNINKVKMAGQSIAIETLICPLAKRPAIRAFAIGLLGVSTALGLIGERQVHGHVQNLLMTQHIATGIDVVTVSAATTEYVEATIE